MSEDVEILTSQILDHFLDFHSCFSVVYFIRFITVILIVMIGHDVDVTIIKRNQKEISQTIEI